jgi:hypothetical protein
MDISILIIDIARCRVRTEPFLERTYKLYFSNRIYCNLRLAWEACRVVDPHPAWLVHAIGRISKDLDNQPDVINK